tara:strand:+ start:220 stop:474 length:255 start_codon:yes stop_codon:yes gene_type:complete
MCINPFNLFKAPKPPKPLLPPPLVTPPAPEEVKDTEKLIDETDSKQKVKTASKKSAVLLTKGSPASKFTSPIPGASKKSGGINI